MLPGLFANFYSGDDAHCAQDLTACPAKRMEMAFGLGPIAAGTILPATVPRGPGDVGAVMRWGPYRRYVTQLTAVLRAVSGIGILGKINAPVKHGSCRVTVCLGSKCMPYAAGPGGTGRSSLIWGDQYPRQRARHTQKSIWETSCPKSIELSAIDRCRTGPQYPLSK